MLKLLAFYADSPQPYIIIKDQFYTFVVVLDTLKPNPQTL